MRQLARFNLQGRTTRQLHEGYAEEKEITQEKEKREASSKQNGCMPVQLTLGMTIQMYKKKNLSVCNRASDDQFSPRKREQKARNGRTSLEIRA